VQDLRYQAPINPNSRDEGGSGDSMPFAGFDPPESNFWRLPNNWFDLAAHFTSWAEHKVVEYILRHTWGYHEYGMVKLITMDEFMRGRKRKDGTRLDAGCGMAENSIKKGINDAVAHGFLIVQTDDSDKGRIKKYYAPRMRRPFADEGRHGSLAEGQALLLQGQDLTHHQQTLTPGVLGMTPQRQQLTPGPHDIDPRTEQKPSQTHLKQELGRNNSRGSVVAMPKLERPNATRTRPVAITETVQTPEVTIDQQATRQSDPVPLSEPVRADLVSRLVAEGIAPARARVLVAKAPSERIERQLDWIDRRTCRDRAATLVRAIEEDFSEPVRRSDRPASGGFDQGKFYRGSFALCSRCGGRPCVPGCTASSE
jgi:hypothetical protein